MKHIVYKTTNLTNNKFYVGMHSCACRPCKYLGSGKALKHAIKKYGRNNFQREILSEHPTREDAFLEEAKVVDKKNPSSYNLTEGGKGIGDCHPSARPITIEGVTYSSQTRAAKALGVDQKTIWNRVNLGYQFKGRRPVRPITYEGIKYSSISEASNTLGIPRTTLTRRINSLTK